jgi:mannose-6-phosphate isomerase-like protein (cupin superfamily)
MAPMAVRPVTQARFGPGDTSTADKSTTHWMENKGSVPTVMLVTGIAKTE